MSPYDQFSAACKAWGLPVPTREHQFMPGRKWRFDYAWPEHRVAVEMEGGIWMRGGGAHSRPANIERDMEKYNAATLRDWRVLRYSPRRMLDAIPEIADALNRSIK